MSTGVASTRVSPVRTHHSVDEVRDAIAFDRLRLMTTYSRLYSVACDCCASDSTAQEDCAGLSVFNRNGKPVGRFHGQQYRAIENANGAISIYSTLVRN